MSIQQIIERLLRSRLYRTGVSIETDSGQRHEGLVQEVRYDGSRSFVVVEDGLKIPLSRITRVERVTHVPAPRAGAVA